MSKFHGISGKGETPQSMREKKEAKDATNDQFVNVIRAVAQFQTKLEQSQLGSACHAQPKSLGRRQLLLPNRSKQATAPVSNFPHTLCPDDSHSGAVPLLPLTHQALWIYRASSPRSNQLPRVLFTTNRSEFSCQSWPFQLRGKYGPHRRASSRDHRHTSEQPQT